jgi:hypothetical protein
MEEAEELCSILEWPHHLYNGKTAKGVLFTPPECETVSLIFLVDGELVCLSKLKYDIHPVNPISVKTQYAAIDVHIAIIKLLKHLAYHYFSVFDLSDEGEYWETGDKEILRKRFGLYNAMLNAVQNALVDFRAEKNDTPESSADRLEKFLNERWKID